MKDHSIAGSPTQSPKYATEEPISEVPENPKKYTAFSVKKSSALDMNVINELKKQNQSQFQLIQNLQDIIK